MYIDKEKPELGEDGTFTLAHEPVKGSEHVYYNGMLQDEGADNDYTIEGRVITFGGNHTQHIYPASQSKVLVSYRTAE